MNINYEFMIKNCI